SGGARRIPDTMSRAEALDQLADTLALAADEAGRAGIELALEHLNQSECNVFTSIAECHAFIEQRKFAGLRLLGDLPHNEAGGRPAPGPRPRRRRRPPRARCARLRLRRLHGGAAPGHV